MKHFSQRVVNKQLVDYHNCVVNHHITTVMYTVFRKKTPTHIFFHISMSYLWI